MKLRLQRSVSCASWLVIIDDDSRFLTVKKPRKRVLQMLFGDDRVVFRGTEQDCRDFIEQVQK
jgi:hypothetical protein